MWFVVVTDEDRKLFAVHGPVSDDTWFHDAVSAGREKNREVNCSTVQEDRTSKERLIAEYQNRGFALSDKALV